MFCVRHPSIIQLILYFVYKFCSTVLPAFKKILSFCISRLLEDDKYVFLLKFTSFYLKFCRFGFIFLAIVITFVFKLFLIKQHFINDKNLTHRWLLIVFFIENSLSKNETFKQIFCSQMIYYNSRINLSQLQVVIYNILVCIMVKSY